MYSNYFYLLRCVAELKKYIINSIIVDCYTQGKDILTLSIPSDEKPYQCLQISTNQKNPYILWKSEQHKSKKNVLDEFPEIISSSIDSIEVADGDRIINFTLSSGNLVFSIRGNQSNIFYYSDSNDVSSFKKSKKKINSILNDHNFIIDFETFGLFDDSSNYGSLTELKKQYPMISSEIKLELTHRVEKDNKGYLHSFKSSIDDIMRDDIYVGYDEKNQIVVFLPESLNDIEIFPTSKRFDNYNAALSYLIAISHKFHKKIKYRSELDKYYSKEILNLSNKVKKLKNRIDEGSKENYYFQCANNLLLNINSLKKGMTEISIVDQESGSSNEIKLDPKKSPHENVEYYFDKARDEKINYQKSLDLLKSSNNTLLLKNEEYDLFAENKDDKSIERLYNSVFSKEKNIIKMDSGSKFKYWHYKIEEKYDVYVGRDSKSNDYLSVKFAKQNDYWFHARGLPGSHVVLRINNTKESTPKNIIKKAASLAEFYSKGKTAGTIPVSYTFAKFVYKKKGMAPGKVMLSKENTILVKPEIPKDCNLISE